MRFKLCTVKKGEEIKTAYLKEVDAKIGNIFNEWEIIEVSLNSITEETLKSLRITGKEKY